MQATDRASRQPAEDTTNHLRPGGQTIERVTPRAIVALAAMRGWPRITLYLPVDRGHPFAHPERVRCLNLVRTAEERLVAAGLEPEAATEALEPARRLVAAPGPWDPAADGLVVFATGGTARAFALPLAPREEVVVGERFYLRPLLGLLGEERRFHILALSQGAVRLLECDDWSARPVSWPAMPVSLVDALGAETEPRYRQLHTASRAADQRTGIFHGRGSAKENTKSELPRFLRQVDAAACAAAAVRGEPLVLAGVGYVVADYRAVSRHPRLVAEAVIGNADEMPDEELRRRALKAVRPAFHLRESRAADRFRELAGTSRVSFDLDPVLEAARQGRIEALFLAEDAESWGRADTAGGVELHPSRRDGDDDLLDLAATLTLGQGGRVYSVPAAEVPSDGPLAAVLRY